MAIAINGKKIPESIIKEEADRIGRDPHWQAVTDPSERAVKIRYAAEFSAINRTLLERAAEDDPRPIDSGLVEAEMLRVQRATNDAAFDTSHFRGAIEKHIRLQRTAKEFSAKAIRPSSSDVREFYDHNRANFLGLPRFLASHIVKHVNADQTEEAALSGISEALAALEAGEDFASVVQRYSDCKENGGNLGNFGTGEMFAEFEAAIADLRPGERTGIFTTPHGFHVAELHEKIPGSTAPFEAARPDIERVLTFVFEQREFLRVLGTLRDAAVIENVPD